MSQGQAEHRLVVDRDRRPVAVEKGGGGGGEGGSSTSSVCHEWVVRSQCRTGRALHHMRHSATVGQHAYSCCVMLLLAPALVALVHGGEHLQQLGMLKDDFVGGGKRR